MLIEINDNFYNKILKYSELNDLDVNTYINHLIEKSFIEDNYSIFNQKKNEEKTIELEKDVNKKDENVEEIVEENDIEEIPVVISPVEEIIVEEHSNEILNKEEKPKKNKKINIKRN